MPLKEGAVYLGLMASGATRPCIAGVAVYGRYFAKTPLILKCHGTVDTLYGERVLSRLLEW